MGMMKSPACSVTPVPGLRIRLLHDNHVQEGRSRYWMLDGWNWLCLASIHIALYVLILLNPSPRCEEFAVRGCKVYATSRNVEKIAAFKDETIERLALDVTSDDDVQRVVQYIHLAEGKLDVVVNNAGGICVGAYTFRWGLRIVLLSPHRSPFGYTVGEGQADFRNQRVCCPSSRQGCHAGDGGEKERNYRECRLYCGRNVSCASRTLFAL